MSPVGSGLLGSVAARVPNEPRLILSLSRPLQRVAPALATRRFTLRAGHAAVGEVLARDADFTAPR